MTDGLTAKEGCIGIRQTVELIEPGSPDNLLDCLMLAISNFLLPCLAGDRRLDRYIRLYDGLLSDFILRCLAQLYNYPIGYSSFL